MSKSLIRWALFFVALLVAGPLAWLTTGRLHGFDGSAHATPMLSATPMIGMLLSIGAILLAGAVALLTAKLVSFHAGLFNAGVTLAWAAWGTSSIDHVARSAAGHASPWMLVVEGLILGLVAAGVFIAIARLCPLGEHEGGPSTDTPTPAHHGATLAIMAAAGFIAAWLVAQNALKGQCVAAAAIAAMIGAAGAMLSRFQSGAGFMAAGIALAGAVGPLVGVLYHGTSPDRGYLAMAAMGKVIPMARLLPMDWIAGGLLGLPMGLALGSWITESRHHDRAAGARAATG